MSDRSEAEIRRLSDEQSILNSILSEQNGKLEALSGSPSISLLKFTNRSSQAKQRFVLGLIINS